MVSLDWRLLAAGFVIAVGLLFYLVARIGAWQRSRVAKRRGARAVRGEHDAEALLEDHGYTIVDRQVRKIWTIQCDDEDWEFDLRADLLVARDGNSYIAEVKTGASAPNLRNAATRRQILEYAIAYQSPTVLLVDVERDEIHEVSFELPPASLEDVAVSYRSENETAPHSNEYGAEELEAEAEESLA